MGRDERRRSSVVQVERADDGVIRVDNDAIRKMSQVDPAIVDQFEEARLASEGEHALTIRDAFKLYPKAIGFSFLFSTAVVVSLLRDQIFDSKLNTTTDGGL
jgi:MFS transporter, SP family, general alpha glucoside:H+ symporter